nr:hypothetical protein [Tessaracoccus aquimaris]
MVFERLTALFASGGSRPPKELQAALAPIKLMGEDVYESLVGYVTTGSPAEALLSFRSSQGGSGPTTGLGTDDVAMLLGNPGASDWPSPWQVRDLEKDIQKATGVKFKASLNDQYRLSLAREALTPEQWVRYGRILESASTVTVLTDDEVVPRWLSILWGTVERFDPDRNQSKGPGWDVGFVRSLLTADGRTDEEANAAIAQLAFVSAPSSSSWQPLRRPVLRGLADFVKDHHDVAVAQYTRSGAEDKAATLTLLGTDADLAAQLDDLWDLAARGTAKGVREQAVAHLATLPSTERASRLAEAVRAAPAAQAETATDYLARVGDAAAIEALNALAAEITDARKSRLLESALARVQQAADGEEADLDLPPVPTIESGRLGDDFVEECMRLSAAANERDKLRLAELPATVQDWQRQAITGRIKVTDRINDADFARIRDYLNDGGKRPKLLDEVIRLGLIPKKGLGLAHQVRLHQLSWQLRNEADLNVDLRALLAVATETEAEVPGRRGTAEDYVSSLPFSWDFVNRVDIENVWPYFAEHPLRLEQSLGMNTTAPRRASTSTPPPTWRPPSASCRRSRRCPRLRGPPARDRARHRQDAQAARAGHPRRPLQRRRHRRTRPHGLPDGGACRRRDLARPDRLRRRSRPAQEGPRLREARDGDGLDPRRPEPARRGPHRGPQPEGARRPGREGPQGQGPRRHRVASRRLDPGGQVGRRHPGRP